jgi:tetratricopeptide (TPR) repeat protein
VDCVTSLSSIQRETAQAFFFSQEPENVALSYRLLFCQTEKDNFDAIEAELPNIIDSVEQGYRRKAWAKVAAFQDALQHFLNFRGHWEESILLNEWGRIAAETLGDQFIFARWTHDRADIYNQQGHYAEAEKLYGIAEGVYKSQGHSFQALESRHMRSIVARAQGKIIQAQKFNEETLRAGKDRGKEKWLPHPLYVRALLARDMGNFTQAKEIIQDCLQRFEGIGDRVMIAHCHHFIGELMLIQGEHGRDVEAHLRYSLKLSEQENIVRRLPATQRLIGDLYRYREDYRMTDKIYNDALEIAMRIGDRPQIGRLMVSKAHLHISRGRIEEAETSLKGALNIYRKIGDTRWIIGVSYLFVRLYLKQKRYWLALTNALRGFKIALGTNLLHPRIMYGAIRRWKWI